ncbi:MAG: hypothetical protein J3R72DRAFT_29641 [Linnemannia gamsii]|nr:MAG: hypothetical protein J3R72DRAFT_29641 [Linnemannia gamsii]
MGVEHVTWKVMAGNKIRLRIRVFAFALFIVALVFSSLTAIIILKKTPIPLLPFIQSQHVDGYCLKGEQHNNHHRHDHTTRPTVSFSLSLQCASSCLSMPTRVVGICGLMLTLAICCCHLLSFFFVMFVSWCCCYISRFFYSLLFFLCLLSLSLSFSLTLCHFHLIVLCFLPSSCLPSLCLLILILPLSLSLSLSLSLLPRFLSLTHAYTLLSTNFQPLLLLSQPTHTSFLSHSFHRSLSSTLPSIPFHTLTTPFTLDIVQQE